MIDRAARHLTHHIRFYGSVCVGVALWAATAGLPSTMRLVAAGDASFTSYLVAVAVGFFGATPKQLRERASSEDEGILLIIVITLLAVILSVYAIIAVLAYAHEPGAVHLTLAILAVPLGWLTFHTIMAFHYAHLFYAQVARKDDDRRDAGGLIFPGEEPPVTLDFLYYSFTVAMTAQVSDVQVCSTEMRRVTLGHGIASFFFNTVILAIAVSSIAELTR